MKKRKIIKVNYKKVKRERKSNKISSIIVFLFVLLFSLLIILFVYQGSLSKKNILYEEETQLGTIGLFSGDGTSENPYLIEDCTQLYNIRNSLDSNYLLMNDIDCNIAPYNQNEGWVPIANNLNRFNGVLNGNFHRITGLYINNNDRKENGLFNYIGASGVVKNLILENIYYNIDTDSGGLVNFNYGLIENCSVTGYMRCDKNSGMIAANNNGRIKSCSAYGTIDPKNSDATDDIGGLVGKNDGFLENSHAYVDVTAYMRVGGLVGRNQNNGVITNCYSYGKVVGNSIALDRSIGGLVGENETGGIITNSFYPNNASINNPTNTIGEIIPDFLINTDNLALIWDFNIWSDINKNYEYLILDWEKKVPIRISNCLMLQGINTISGLSRNYELTQNIDCHDTIHWDSGKGFMPIGSSLNGFNGVFDGKGYTIIGLYINRSLTDVVGLFSYTKESAVIKNLGLVSMNLADADSHVGTLVGNNSGLIYRCYSKSLSISSTNPIIDINKNVGGLVGNNWGTISKCFSQGTIQNTEEDTGGIAGENNGLILNSYSNTNIIVGSSGTNDIGGITGHNKENGVINNSYYSGILNTGSGITCSAKVDGVGGIAGKNTGLIMNSYSTGNFSGDENVGGLVGESDYANALILNSYSYSKDVSACKKAGGLVGKLTYGTIRNSYSISNVTGAPGISNIGGLVSRQDSGIVENSFYSENVIINPVDVLKDGYLIGRESKTNMIDTAWLQTNGWIFPPWSYNNDKVDYPYLFFQENPKLNPIGAKSVLTNNLLSFKISGIDYNYDVLNYSVRTYDIRFDINKDSNFDNLDILLFLDIYSEGGYNIDADINGDGNIDELDVQLIFVGYNSKPSGIVMDPLTGEFTWTPSTTGAYILSFMCAKTTESFSKYMDSETMTITVSSPPVDTPVTPPGGGGGGGGSSSTGEWTSTFNVDSTKLSAGYTKTLLEKQRLTFKIGSTTEYIGVINIETGYVIIKSSLDKEPSFNIYLGSEKKMDFNNDGYYDILLRLKTISGTKSEFYIKGINEKIAVEEIKPEPTEPEPVSPTEIPTEPSVDENPEKTIDWMLYFLIFAIVAIVVAISVAFIYFLSEKKKEF
jgi:hypothetical protein